MKAASGTAPPGSSGGSIRCGIATSAGLQLASAQTADTAAAAKARAKVESMGLGSSAKVEVKLQDQTKLKGYLSAKERDSFTITDSKTGATSTVRYAEVVEVKNAGGGFSTKGWIIVGAAAALKEGATFRPVVFIATLVCALLIQIGTNFANDYSDFHRGADHEGRLGPLRVTQSGLISANSVRRGRSAA